MSDIGDRVRKRRDDRGWSQTYLAKLVGVRPQSIQALEAGKTRRPRYLYELARALDCHPDDLLDGKVAGSRRRVFNVPVISHVEAGKLGETTDAYPVGEGKRTLPVIWEHGHLIGLEVEGNSINKIAAHGSVVFVDLNDRTAVDGKLFAFRQGERATVKVYRRGPPERLDPASDDPEYRAIVPDGPVEIIGRVIGKWEDL